MTEKEKEVQNKIQGRVKAYQTPAMLSGRGGGAALLTRAAWRRFSSGFGEGRVRAERGFI
jgi:hypothetical protein